MVIRKRNHLSIVRPDMKTGHMKVSLLHKTHQKMWLLKMWTIKMWLQMGTKKPIDDWKDDYTG